MSDKSENLSVLGLPNCILLNLLIYFDSSSLYNISRTCQRLRDLANTSILWRHIDARAPPNDLEKLDFCIGQVHEHTHTLLVRGADNPTPLETFTFNRLALHQNIKILALENVVLPETYGPSPECESITDLHLKYFPKHITELSLRKSHIKNPQPFFRFSDEFTQNLRVLILDECEWVTTAIFLPVSKYKNLEIFSVYKCRHIENSIPYLGLAGVCGFKKLRILDARLTELGNTLLGSIYRSSTLTAIYLQSYNDSYKRDRLRFKPDDESVDSLQLSTTNHLTDKGIFNYNHAISIRKSPRKVDSYLYKDPYDSCDCKLIEKAKHKRAHSDPPEGTRPQPKRRRIEDAGPSRPIPVEINGLFDEIIQIVVDRDARKVETPLKRLSARGCQLVTDNSLNYLKNVDLDVLDVTYTNVTRRGVEDYLLHNPSCRVIHENYCECLPGPSNFE